MQQSAKLSKQNLEARTPFQGSKQWVVYRREHLNSDQSNVNVSGSATEFFFNNLQKLPFALKHSGFSLINHHYAEMRVAKHIYIGVYRQA